MAWAAHLVAQVKGVPWWQIPVGGISVTAVGGFLWKIWKALREADAITVKVVDKEARSENARLKAELVECDRKHDLEMDAARAREAALLARVNEGLLELGRKEGEIALLKYQLDGRRRPPPAAQPPPAAE